MAWRMIRLIALCLLLTLLAGALCGAGECYDSLFEVEVVNDCADELYGVHIDYGLNGEMLGGQYMVLADGSALPRGESAWFGFCREDIPADTDDLAGFTMEVYAIGADGAEHPAGVVMLNAQEGCTYRLRLSDGAGYTVALDGAGE